MGTVECAFLASIRLTILWEGSFALFYSLHTTKLPDVSYRLNANGKRCLYYQGFICPICMQAWSNQEELLQHWQSVHNQLTQVCYSTPTLFYSVSNNIIRLLSLLTILSVGHLISVSALLIPYLSETFFNKFNL